MQLNAKHTCNLAAATTESCHAKAQEVRIKNLKADYITPGGGHMHQESREGFGGSNGTVMGKRKEVRK